MAPVFIFTQTPNMEFSLSHIDEKKILAALHFTGLFDVFYVPCSFSFPPFFWQIRVCVCLFVLGSVCMCSTEKERDVLEQAVWDR